MAGGSEGTPCLPLHTGMPKYGTHPGPVPVSPVFLGGLGPGGSGRESGRNTAGPGLNTMVSWKPVTWLDKALHCLSFHVLVSQPLA